MKIMGRKNYNSSISYLEVSNGSNVSQSSGVRTLFDCFDLAATASSAVLNLAIKL